MMTLGAMQTALSDRNLRKVAELAKVSYSSVRKILAGNGGSLPVSTAQKISDYLEGK